MTLELRACSPVLRSFALLGYSDPRRRVACLSSVQAHEIVEKDIGNGRKLVWKAARSGIIEVWKVLVEAVEAAGQHVLEQVSHNAGRLSKLSTLRRTSSHLTYVTITYVAIAGAYCVCTTDEQD